MQLGTRWAVGAEPPARLPPPIVAAIGSLEADLVGLGVDARAWRWTLTWLESLPVVQLDDGTTIRCEPGTDAVTVSHED